MRYEVRRAAAGIAVVFFGCNVYDPSILTGPKNAGGRAGSTFAGSGGDSAAGGEDATGGSLGGTTAGGGNGGSNAGTGSGGKGGGGKGGSGGSGGSNSGATSGTGGDGASGGSSGEGGDTGAGGMADGGQAGDGEGGGGTGGTGGDGGTGGGGTGAAGSGAAGSAGAGSGGAGSGGTGGAGGAGPCATTGCARLSMDAFTTIDQKAHYVVSFANTVNLTGATVSYRIYKQAGTNGEFRGYLQNGGPNFEFSLLGGQALSSLTGWTTVTFDAADEQGNVNLTSVKRIGIEVIGAPAGPWEDTVIYVDSITVTPPAGTSPWQFATEDTVHETGGTVDQAAGVIWFNNGSTDTTVANAELAWFGGP
jgi:hypothetical protein